MPHLFPVADGDDGHEIAIQKMDDETSSKQPRHASLLKNLGGLWKRHQDSRDVSSGPQTTSLKSTQSNGDRQARSSSVPNNSGHRRCIPSLPRPQTFCRQESERREKLLEVPPSPTERRAVSVDRRRGFSASAARRPLSPKPIPISSLSASEVPNPHQQPQPSSGGVESDKDVTKQSRNPPELTPLAIPDREVENEDYDDEDEINQDLLQEEYDRRWILNLSMHFRDKSNREKFFVTYAETPSKWRRITISLDYRNAPEDSLEADLSTLHYQRDKSFRIYEAIRESLPDIQYYNTVTNLKLETTSDDGQLHVHVREDANEIIRFPSVDLFAHIRARHYRESEVEFISHLSGFVYKVHADGETVIKKEIPGPDTVDEFLYEVNALDSLLGSRYVVQLQGLVTDDSDTVVKGLLISYASKGALVDMLFDYRTTSELPWYRREKWAKQIVQGLSDVHEAGFVQGDFTLSNVVIDEHDNAIIIDINRRGCPVGWEPPELGRLIDSGQRIGMCIGVKTDLFQLGMVLWSLAELNDEPERVERPLPPLPAPEIPPYYHSIVQSCLSPHPQARPSAKRLHRQFPAAREEYIDPATAVTLEDVAVSYFNPSSTTYRFGSSGGSWVVGRSPGRRSSRFFPRSASDGGSSATSVSRSPPSRSRRRRCSSESSREEDKRDVELLHTDSGFGEGVCFMSEAAHFSPSSVSTQQAAVTGTG